MPRKKNVEVSEENLLESEEDDLITEDIEDDLPHPDTPSRDSSEWNDYVLSLLEKGEYVEQKGKRYPTAAGLRRLSELLLGQVVESRPTETSIIAVPGPIGYVASVTYVVVFSSHDGGLLTYGDSADVNQFNCAHPFSLHATATAATRAEARALRKALRLRCIAAEELDGGAADMAPVDTEPVVESTNVLEKKFIGEPVIRFIDTKCKQLNINVMKLIGLGSGTYQDHWPVSSIDEVTIETGEGILRTLKEFMNDKSLINESVLGYSANWRKE